MLDHFVPLTRRFQVCSVWVCWVSMPRCCRGAVGTLRALRAPRVRSSQFGNGSPQFGASVLDEGWVSRAPREGFLDRQGVRRYNPVNIQVTKNLWLGSGFSFSFSAVVAEGGKFNVSLFSRGDVDQLLSAKGLRCGAEERTIPVQVSLGWVTLTFTGLLVLYSQSFSRTLFLIKQTSSGTHKCWVLATSGSLWFLSVLSVERKGH